MTRSSLLLLQRCFPNSFACYVGSASGELIASSDLAEPVWAGLLRWYLPFVITMFTLYFPLVILAHIFLSNMLRCGVPLVCELPPGAMVGNSPLSRPIRGLLIATHGIIDVPLPVGLLHAWMTVLEVGMNNLVMRLSTQFHKLERAVPGSTLLADPYVCLCILD
jgi:hypothetical protein